VNETTQNGLKHFNNLKQKSAHIQNFFADSCSQHTELAEVIQVLHLVINKVAYNSSTNAMQGPFAEKTPKNCTSTWPVTLPAFGFIPVQSHQTKHGRVYAERPLTRTATVASDQQRPRRRSPAPRTLSSSLAVHLSALFVRVPLKGWPWNDSPRRSTGH